MRNELYDHHLHHHHHHSINDNQKRIFMPMFCRLSVKDVQLNNHYRDPTSAACEPSSPKVTCIGQVKRNNRVVGFPAAATTTSYSDATANHHQVHHKPIKLNKLFSSKTLLPNTTTAMNLTTTAKSTGGGRRSGSRSCRSGREMRVTNSRRPRVKRTSDCDQEYCVVKVVDIGEMDPPLPVVKRVAPPPEVNIWKRRFNGRVGLQIEPIHLPNNTFEPPPTTV